MRTARMERGLLAGVPLLRRDRASPACATCSRPAFLARLSQVLPAGSVVERGAWREGGDRISRKARPLRALVARIWVIFARAELKPLSEPECSAVGMPRAPFRMNEHTQARAIDRLGSQRPALEIKPGRPIEWIECPAIKISRDLIDQPLGPSVEGIGKTVIGLLRGREHRPLVAACPAQQHDC